MTGLVGWAERIGEGGGDEWGKHGFRVKPGMTMGGVGMTGLVGWAGRIVTGGEDGRGKHGFPLSRE